MPRPEPPDVPMSKEVLSQYKRSLTMLSPDHVRDAYRKAFERCRMVDDRLPRSTAIQELVAAWTQLWKWKK